MIAVYCFYPGDEQLALKNVQWWNELGGCHGHEILVAHDPRCNPETAEAIRLELVKCFDKVYKCSALAVIDGWPEGANYFFRITTTWLQGDPGKWPYFFWLEPDAVPLRPGWMDKMEAEHKRGGMPFTGDRVQVGDIPLHMSGIGIYENPIYNKAGECYRAHDTAWDMAAKDQIVPNAFFTDLIEHAWKHPRFTSQDELHTQIAPQTLLFHSSKDGSLIDLLRKAAAPGRDQNSVPTEPTTGSCSPSREEIGTRAAQPIYDIFIRTYPGDYEWLNYCLKSINKFVSGFRKIWIVSPEPWIFSTDIDEVEWKVMPDETPDGYLAQQITKLYADVITDYQADYILHVDSDVIFTKPTQPEDFFSFPDGKMKWIYTPHELIQTPWKPIMEKFMGFHQPYEFMRRLPLMVPRWLYPKLREFCHKMHGQVISDYIKMQPQRAFSEFNMLGAYAFFHHRDRFEFVDTSTVPTLPIPCAKQFHSWSGLTPEVKAEIEGLLGGMGDPKGAPPVSSQIKKLPSGVWVLEGDQISDWVIQEGRLDHDQNLLPDILPHIRPGDTVVDAGAFIGDHTVAYSDAVGDTGMVHAFEPNPLAYQCLSHNLEERNNVVLHDYGLSDAVDTVPLSGNNGNWGGAYVGDHMKITDVRVRALETEIPWRVNFIKIDVEGYELKVLQGAGNLIRQCCPIMVIEINTEALRRQGTTPDEIFGWLTQHNYDWRVIQSNALRNDPLYDILCLPKKPPEKIKADSSAHTPESSPVASPKMMVYDCIDYIKKFADASPGNKAIVSSRLVYVGLRKPNKKKTPYANDPFKPTRKHRKRKQSTEEHPS